MNGNIRKRGNGWQITIWAGKKPDGTPLRYYETIKGSKTDAQIRRRELLSGMDKGIPIPTGQLTLADLLDQWLAGYVKNKCSDRTYDGYETIVIKHLKPNLGHILLRQLDRSAIEIYYGKAGEKLSARTIQHQHRILSEALKWSVRKGILGRNPCDMVDAPKPRKTIMRTLTPPEVDRLLNQASSSRFYPVIYMAISSGLRRAELLGLRWRDIDLDMLSISVSRVLYKRRGVVVFKEPKTEHSQRQVAMTPKLAIFLREYKRQREILNLELGRPLALDDLVFSNIDGDPLDPCTLTHEFSKIARLAGLGKVRFHDLRHTFASLMLLRGAQPKVISEALGHASVAFTMDVYSHTISGMQENAMALLDEIMPPGVLASNERQGA
ncbi:MAG: site-specific integrase [Dehalococcoidia bacterium]